MRAREPLEGRLERRRKLLARVLGGLDGAVIVVEGKHDTDALRRIGVKGKIIELNGSAKGVCRKVLGERKGAGRIGRGKMAEALDASEKVGDVGGAEQEVVVLTDSDAAGEELAERVVGELEGCNLKPDMQARRDLRYALGVKRIEEIEGKMREFEMKLKKQKMG